MATSAVLTNAIISLKAANDRLETHLTAERRPSRPPPSPFANATAALKAIKQCTCARVDGTHAYGCALA
jgi:hypothetical protein